MPSKILTSVDTWINKRTGEVVEAITTVSDVTDRNFDKVWLGILLSALDIIGNRKMKVVRYLLENRSRTENTVTATQRLIADKTGVSIRTVNDTIRALREAGVLTQIIPSHYRINPSVVWRGSHHGRMAVMARFRDERDAVELPLPIENTVATHQPHTMNEEKTVATAPC